MIFVDESNMQLMKHSICFSYQQKIYPKLSVEETGIQILEMYFVLSQSFIILNKATTIYKC